MKGKGEEGEEAGAEEAEEEGPLVRLTKKETANHLVFSLLS